VRVSQQLTVECRQSAVQESRELVKNAEQGNKTVMSNA